MGVCEIFLAADFFRFSAAYLYPFSICSNSLRAFETVSSS